MSEEERQLRERWEQEIQEEEKRIREEREQHISRPGLTEKRKRLRRVIRHRAVGRIQKDSNAADEKWKLLRGGPKAKMSEEVREKWEQRIQEEEERMRFCLQIRAAQPRATSRHSISFGNSDPIRSHVFHAWEPASAGRDTFDPTVSCFTQYSR